MTTVALDRNVSKNAVKKDVCNRGVKSYWKKYSAEIAGAILPMNNASNTYEVYELLKEMK